MIVPTQKSSSSTKQKKIDVASLSSEELTSLKAQDPFMYYSIPAVRIAVLLDKDVGVSTLQLKTAFQVPVKEQNNEPDEDSMALTVTRQSRLSFECHPYLVMDELLTSLQETDCSDEGSDDEDDYFLSYVFPSAAEK